MSRQRDPYAEVGERTRRAIDRAMAHKPTRTALAALVAVIHYLTTRSLFGDHVGHRQLQEVAQLDDRSIRRGLRELAAAGVIVYRPGFSTPEGGRTASWIELPTPDTTAPGTGGHTAPGTPGGIVQRPRVETRRDPGSHSPLSENSPRSSPRSDAQRHRLAAGGAAAPAEAAAASLAAALAARAEWNEGQALAIAEFVARVVPAHVVAQIEESLGELHLPEPRRLLEHATAGMPPKHPALLDLRQAILDCPVVTPDGEPTGHVLARGESLAPPTRNALKFLQPPTLLKRPGQPLTDVQKVGLKELAAALASNCPYADPEEITDVCAYFARIAPDHLADLASWVDDSFPAGAQPRTLPLAVVDWEADDSVSEIGTAIEQDSEGGFEDAPTDVARLLKTGRLAPMAWRP